MDQRGQLSLTLSPVDEQSGNEGVRRTLAICSARKASASIKAAHTIAVGDASPSLSRARSDLAGTSATGTIRMMLRHRLPTKKKAPDQPGP